MPVAPLLALEEVGVVLGSLASGAEAVFAFVGERWWLASLADVVVRHISNGKATFPRSLTQAASIGGRLLFEQAANAIDSATLKRALQEAASFWESHVIIELAQRQGALNLDLAAAANLITQDIPEGESLPEWLSRMQHQTGYSRDRIMEMRNSFKEMMSDG
jgi:hypothetical protein